MANTGPGEGAIQDDVLVEWFRNGERSAFDTLYHRYKARILNYLYRLLGDRSAAEELSQEVFINVYTHIDRYDQRGFFKAWLYTIASNLAKNALKRKRREEFVSLSETIGSASAITLGDALADEHLSPESIIKNKELKQRIGSVIRSLPRLYRDVIMLCVIEKLSYEEAARILRTNAKTISSRLVTARALFIKGINRSG